MFTIVDFINKYNAPLSNIVLNDMLYHFLQHSSYLLHYSCLLQCLFTSCLLSHNILLVTGCCFHQTHLNHLYRISFICLHFSSCFLYSLICIDFPPFKILPLLFITLFNCVLLHIKKQVSLLNSVSHSQIIFYLTSKFKHTLPFLTDFHL